MGGRIAPVSKGTRPASGVIKTPARQKRPSNSGCEGAEGVSQKQVVLNQKGTQGLAHSAEGIKSAISGN